MDGVVLVAVGRGLLEVMGQWESSFLFLTLYFFIWAVPGLCCCAGFSLPVGSESYSLGVVHGLLPVVASLRHMGSRAHGLGNRCSLALEHRLSRCSARASLLCGMWNLPGPLHWQAESQLLGHQGSPSRFYFSHSTNCCPRCSCLLVH